LLVGLDHDAARQVELLGEDTRRRERGLGAETARSDRPAELLLELSMEGEGVVPV
jgi:hypothetical protein